jgi:hypothetical protein
MSTFAKVLLVGGGFSVVAVIAVAVAGVAFMKRVSVMIGDFKDAPAATLAGMAEKLGDDVSVVSTDEDEGRVVLRVGSAGELVTVDLAQSAEPEQEAAEQGVRFEGEADESGGILHVDTEAGRTSVELRGGEDGGFLDISTPDHELRFGAGTGSSALPRWVPVYPGAVMGKRLFSAEFDEGSVGGAELRSDATPQEIFEWYQEALEGRVETVTSRTGSGGLERAKIETGAWGVENRRLVLQFSEYDDGGGRIVIVYRTGDEGR